jgi:hypothetical protein
LLLRGCPLASCMHVFIAAISPIVLVLSLGLCGLLSGFGCFRSRSFSRLLLSFLLAVLPVRVPSGSSRSRGSSGGLVPPVV